MSAFLWFIFVILPIHDYLPLCDYLSLKVTSPGGTTASALYELERGGYRTVMADAGR
jgi:pyrroline-5-carboxylate reductase